MKSNPKILVTTDLSDNSKSAIHFALHLATQTPCKLVFFHVLELLVPTGWSKESSASFAQSEIQKAKTEMKKFLDAMLKKTELKDYDYDVEIAANVDSRIVEYAQKIQADFICMSTRGAGTLKKIIGTNASILVNTSPIPTLIVPQHYRVKPITKVAYASDLENIDTELMIVKQFALPLKAFIEVYHYNYNLQDMDAKEDIIDIVSKYQSDSVSFNIPQLYLEFSLVENLQRAVKKSKPSVLVMFTHEKKNWFERFFWDSKTAEMTYDIKIPMLAIRK